MMSDKNRISVRLSDNELARLTEISSNKTMAIKALINRKEGLGAQLELTEFQANFIRNYAETKAVRQSDAVRQLIAIGINTLLLEAEGMETE